MDVGSRFRSSSPASRRSTTLGAETAQELLDALLELYGEFERIVAALNEAGAAGESLRTRLAEDGVV